MFKCLGLSKPKKEPRQIVTGVVLDKFRKDDDDYTEDDISIDESAFVQEYSQINLCLENIGKVIVDRILNQRTCRNCRFISYYVTFHPLVILKSDIDAFSKNHAITEAVEFEENDREYLRVKCAPRWLSEVDMFYVSFPSERRYRFVKLPITMIITKSIL